MFSFKQLKKLLFIFALYFTFSVSAEEVKPDKDSLEICYNSAVHDTVKFKAIERLLHNFQEDYDVRVKWSERLEGLAKASGRRDLLALSDFLFGTVYYDFSKYNKAITYYYKALPVAEELNLLWLQSKIFNYLGIISSDQGNSKRAVYYFRKTYDIAVKLKDVNQQFVAANNIGVDYNTMNSPVLALYYLNIAEGIARKYNAYHIMPSLAGNKMQCYLSLNDFKNAKIQLDSMHIYVAKDKKGGGHEVSANYFTGYYYTYTNEYKKAIPYFKRNIEIIPATDLNEIKKNYTQLHECFYNLNDYKSSYDYLFKVYQLHDSLSGAEKLRAANETESKYRIFKTEKELEIQKLNNINQSLKLKRSRITIALTSVILILLVVGFVFVYRLLKDKQKANKILENQNTEITSQKKEILDSINYSKRIQDGILPDESELQEKIGDHFVFYQSKDIVSGDYYWASKRNNDKFIIACCDSTGHGVPGAFMSLLGYSLLNKSEEADNSKSPAGILNYLNTELPKVFKSENRNEQIKDGMDISICEVDRENLIMKVSGANNSIYHITNNELFVIKSQKNAVSASSDNNNYVFEDKTVKLDKGDLIVMFTDGFADQFGGPKGKKFKYKQLEEILVANCKLPLNEQKQKLIDSFNSWKNNLEQVDDICIIGIKV